MAEAEHWTDDDPDTDRRLARSVLRTDAATINPWLLWNVETPADRQVLSVAEMAECCCPDLCDRDHANE